MDVTIARNKSVSDGLDALIAGGLIAGQIGWTESDIHIDPETGEISLVADDAILNEFGGTQNFPDGSGKEEFRHIPARPFLRNTIRRESSAWLNTMGEESKKVLDNKVPFDDVLLTVTSNAITDVRETVRNRITPPLAEITLKKRFYFTRGASKPTGTLPLYNTGHMMNTLTNEIIPA